MPFATGPYSAHSSLPSPAGVTAHSSRLIDPTTRRYKLDDDGSPEQMPSTRQRVLLQLSFAAGPPPKLITDADLERRRKRIIQALELLTKEGAIRVEGVTVTEVSPGAVEERVDYTDLGTGTNDSITRTL